MSRMNRRLWATSLLLAGAGCATASSAGRVEGVPEWIHWDSFYELESDGVVVYGVARIAADSRICSPHWIRKIAFNRAVIPIQEFLGQGSSEVTDRMSLVSVSTHDSPTTRSWATQSTRVVRTTAGTIH